MKIFTSSGVKKGHFGVTDVKIDSQVLSLKNGEIQLASI